MPRSPSASSSADRSAAVGAAEAGAYLEGLINLERRPDLPYSRMGLEPIRALLERAGNPERRLSVINVAGSKGKGSTCLFCEGILAAAQLFDVRAKLLDGPGQPISLHLAPGDAKALRPALEVRRG